MTPERWRQIEDLFNTALERDPSERSALLAIACPTDPELRQQVEALLHSFEEAGNFIEETPFAGAMSAIADESTKESGEAIGNARLIGCRFGHYEIQSLLGAGGMGEVYLAHDLKLERQIAVKILPAQFTRDIAQVQRFEREARAASGLNHPNIITIHEIARDDDTHFIATEFVAGQTLREKITLGQMPLNEALNVAIQIAEALTAAHSAGIVHRDIKPENVMVRPDGLVKVLDFGLAKPTGREPKPGGVPSSTAVTFQTDPAMLMGTLAYLSPEQVLRKEVDHRTDLFSLGVVLHEMVTGTRPFVGVSAAAVCEAILRNEVTVSNPKVPLKLKRIILRALEKDRAARYQTAVEMRNDLQRQIAAANEARGLSSRRRVAAAAVVVLALLGLAVMLVMSLRNTTTSEQSSFSPGPVKRITVNAGQEIFPSLSPDGQSVVYASRSSGTWDIYLQKVGESKALNLTPDGRHVDLSPVFSPDGTRIAFSSSRDGEGIFLMDVDGRNVVRLCPDGYNPAWSPDGKEIAVAEDRIFDYEGRNHTHSGLFALNVQTGARRLITNGDAVQPNWSPHGQRIAYWGVHKGGQRDIWTVPSSGGEPVAVTSDREVDWNPIWSRDGKYLYFLSDRGGSMNLWRVAVDELSGKVVGQLEPATLPSANSQHISFSPDGRTLVYVETNRRENTWQVPFDPVTARITGKAVQLTHGVRRYSQPDLSPDERLLAFVSVAEAQEDVFVINLDGSGLRQLTNDSAQDRIPRWSPDGRQIAFLSDRSGKYEIWKVNQDGSGLEQLSDVPGEDVTNFVWSPDGEQLLYRVSDANAFIVEVGKPHQPPRPLSGQQMPGFLPWSWSPDEKLLAGWQFDPQQHTGGVIIYSFGEQRYELQSNRGRNPIWLSDSKRLISADVGKMYLFDIRSGQWRDLYNVEPGGFGTFGLSRDNRRLYYSLVSSEADIWQVSLN